MMNYDEKNGNGYVDKAKKPMRVRIFMRGNKHDICCKDTEQK